MTDDPFNPLSSVQYLTASAEASKGTIYPVSRPCIRNTHTFHAGAITALLTNPIWVVKVRMFTSPPDDPQAYRGLIRALPLFVSLVL